jgi:hypothetical protein
MYPSFVPQTNFSARGVRLPRNLTGTTTAAHAHWREQYSRSSRIVSASIRHHRYWAGHDVQLQAKEKRRTIVSLVNCENWPR